MSSKRSYNQFVGGYGAPKQEYKSGVQLVVVNDSNLVAGTTNTYTLKLQSVVEFGAQSEIALAQGQQTQSWNNIGSEFTNQQISLTWIDGVTTNIVIPSGLYEISDISDYLKFICKGLGWYLTDNTDPNNPIDHYYQAIVANVPYNKAQMDFTTLPNALPANWAYGAGTGAAWVTSVHTPFIIIPAAPQAMSTLLGFAAGTYPTVNTATVSVLGASTPKLTPVNTVFVNCSLVSNPNTLGNNYQSIWSYAANGLLPRASFTYNIPEFIWLPIVVTQTQLITITLNDQNGSPLNQTDTEASWVLYIKQR